MTTLEIILISVFAIIGSLMVGIAISYIDYNAYQKTGRSFMFGIKSLNDKRDLDKIELINKESRIKNENEAKNRYYYKLP